jgi:glycosyltransferase involved in cell wall biosynthesis
MKVLALPRDPNPYQDLLYEEMRAVGVEVTFIGELTPSRTLSILLLPIETACQRLKGARIVHLHWVFAFSLPYADRFPILRSVSSLLFVTWLGVCRALGIRIVWTAHNVLPHERVFVDDVKSRRRLVAFADLVIVHSSFVLSELASLGAVPHRSATIRHGPFRTSVPSSQPVKSREGGPAREFLFFGRVQEYKGVEDLMKAFATLPEEFAAHLTVAGKCNDARLLERLLSLSSLCRSSVTMRLEFLTDEDLADLIRAADVVVLPFREVTTSGSAILALSWAKPLIVPDLPAFADLPSEAVVRYSGQTTGLPQALAELARAEESELLAMSQAAYAGSRTVTWRHIAIETRAEMAALVGAPPSAGHCHRPRRAP